jgi:hypothetical protein
MVTKQKFSLLSRIIPYISLFIFVLGVYLVFDLLRDVGPYMISHKVNKLVGITIIPVGIILELTKTRDQLWNTWKNIPIYIHIVVTLFFSSIILKLLPIAWQTLWNEEQEK